MCGISGNSGYRVLSERITHNEPVFVAVVVYPLVVSRAVIG